MNVQHHEPPTSSSSSHHGFLAWCRRHDLALFFGLAFAISWAVWPLILLNPDSSPLVPFGPLIAALVVTLLTRGIAGVGRLLAQLGRWRRSPRWYLIGIVGPVALTGIAAVTTTALAGRPELGDSLSWQQIVATMASTMVIVGLFEELGWRGYALPRLEQRFPARRSAVLLGIIWAAWHLPELISDPTGQRPPAPFLIFVLAQSIVLAWLYTSSRGGLPLVIVSHAATNTTAQLVLPLFAGPSYVILWWCLTALWASVAVLVAVLAGPRLETHLRR